MTDTLILCSPTPDETLKNVRAKQVVFMAGEKETWVILEINRMAKTLKCPYTVQIIPNTGHKIDNAYKEALLDAVKEFSK